MNDQLFPDNTNSTTAKFIAAGLLFAIIANISYYAFVFDTDWLWARYIFPIGWLSLGMGYMATFFHELGHTAFAWFYGYPTLPMFDFQHGGGLALSTSGQQILILACVWGACVYGFIYFKDNFYLKWLCAFALGLNLIFAFNDGHEFFINFFGPAAEPIVASFLIYRALFDLAPRGALERFLNAGIGLSMIGGVFINAIGLLNNEAHRLAYFQQKGSHGFGDFDKIGYQINALGFNGIVWVWLLLNVICLVLPFWLYKRAQDQY